MIVKPAVSPPCKIPNDLFNFEAMNKFRLPRKVKGKLRGNIWLYPADEKGNSIMAFPRKSQEDYNAVKNGVARDIMYRENPKAEKKAYREKMNKETTVTDEELRTFVDNIFAERFRTSSYNTLIKAKNNPKAVVAYYNFINAYKLSKKDDSYGNVCCMAVDKAKELLKK